MMTRPGYFVSALYILIMNKDKISIPLWTKVNLTIEEASIYSNIGICKIRELLNDPLCDFVLHVGNKKLVKRKEFEKFLEFAYEI